ncbi:MAG TPA: DUF2079 domain-containing protein [Mycobacteriales bacterium]|nr:DUF2079 domain-containing protein [Mycobacteriales bacterium]
MTAGRQRFAPWVLALGAALLYAALGLDRNRTLSTSAYDLGIFHEAVSGWAHFGWPRVPLKGVSENLGDHYNLLADHFHPLLVLWAPGYWIWPHPVTLQVEQAITLALAIIPIWRFTARKLESERLALGTALTFMLAWGITRAVGFDVHESSIAVPLLALAIERADAGRWRTATVAGVLLLGVKEDLGLTLAAFGLWIVVAHREQWKRGAALIVTGVAGYYLTVHVVMPAFDHGKAYMYWSYAALGPDLPSALRHVLLHPGSTVRVALQGRKPTLLAWTFLPIGWIGFLSPLILLTLPLLAERILSNRVALSSLRFHYAATTVPVLMLAVVDGLRRASPQWRQRAVLLGLATAVVLTFFIPTGFAFLFSRFGLTTDARVRDGIAAIEAVPRDARVAASTRLVPHLIDRCGKPLCPVYLLDGTGRDVAHSDWIVADVTSLSFPFTEFGEVQTYVDGLEAQGWTVAFSRGGYVVIHRPGT